MIENLSVLFPAILLSAVVAVVFAPVIGKAFGSLGILDIPGSAPHKVHAAITPLAGGPVLWLSIALTVVALQPGLDRAMAGILIGATLLLAWGIIDDRTGLAPLGKLAGQLIVAAILVVFSVQVRMTQIPWLDLTLTMLWVVGLINAYNFVDSMDGLALGLAGIAAAFFMLATLDAGQPSLAFLSAVLLGAALGLFYFNAPPARIFLGDSGSQMLGFLLAAVGIAYVPAGAGLPQAVSWFTPILVMGLPIFDTVLVVASRIRRRVALHSSLRDHTYDRFVALGLNSSRAVLAMQLVAILLGLISFITLRASVIVANAVFGSVVLIGVIAVIVLERVASPDEPQTRNPDGVRH